MTEKTLTAEDIQKHIDWLESEIDTCLEYDLPAEHFASDLDTLKQISSLMDLPGRYPVEECMQPLKAQDCL